MASLPSLDLLYDIPLGILGKGSKRKVPDRDSFLERYWIIIPVMRFTDPTMKSIS